MPDEPELKRDPAEITTVFSNFLSVTSTPEEVFLEFGIRDREDPNEVRVTHAIIVTPTHAQRIVKTIEKNLEGWRQRFEEFAKEVQELEEENEEEDDEPAK